MIIKFFVLSFLSFCNILFGNYLHKKSHSVQQKITLLVELNSEDIENQNLQNSHTYKKIQVFIFDRKFLRNFTFYYVYYVSI